jgi:hypothetical protein
MSIGRYSACLQATKWKLQRNKMEEERHLCKEEEEEQDQQKEEQQEEINIDK